MPGLLILQIITGLILIGLIVLQAKGGGLGTAFGGQAFLYHTKKGVEKLVFYLTVLAALILSVITLINLKLL